MRGKFLITLSVVWLAIAGCKKDNASNNGSNTASQALELNVLTDFTANLANPNYQDIQAKAQVMNRAITTNDVIGGCHVE